MLGMDGRPSVILKDCPRHGRTRFHLRRDGSHRCGRCSSEAVSRRRRRVKQILVDEAGGRCAICGYSRYVGALEFHHRDPATKSFGLGCGGLTRSLDKARAEAAKCVLLCANCHAEVEAAIVALPDEAPDGGRLGGERSGVAQLADALGC